MVGIATANKSHQRISGYWGF